MHLQSRVVVLFNIETKKARHRLLAEVTHCEFQEIVIFTVIEDGFREVCNLHFNSILFPKQYTISVNKVSSKT